MEKYGRRNIALYGILISGAVIFLLLYTLFDPVETSWMPQCVFYHLTGWKCIGCGAQRMLHSLLHGDLSGAWRANAFLICSLPALIFLIWLELFKSRYPILYRRIHSVGMIITTAAILMAWLLIRNLFRL